MSYDTNDVMDEIAKVMGEIGEGVKDMRVRVDKIEMKQNRARLPGGGGAYDTKTDDEDLAAIEHKAIGYFARCNTGMMVAFEPPAELKAHSVGSDPEGGYFVTPVLSSTMTQRLFNYSPMRRLARSVTIVTGDSFEEPLDVNDVGATWVGEKQSRPETSTGEVGMLNVPVNEIYALVPVTQRLLDDSGFNIGLWLEGKISDKFARSEGTAYVTGDGIKKPRGFMSYPTDSAVDITRAQGKLQYIVSGDANTVTADGLRDLYWGMRAPHRAQASWLMASATANSIDKLKSGDGDYLWRDGMTAGAPPSLLGRPVEFCEDMPTIAAGNYPIAFGDFQRGYICVDKAGVKVLRDPFTDKPRVVFYAYRRAGGAVANFDAIKLLKISA